MRQPLKQILITAPAILLWVLFMACNLGNNSKVVNEEPTEKFNFDAPSQIYNLPKKLREISGITALNDSLVACVQDEKANIYFFNLNTGAIDYKIDFGKNGDYEGIARMNDSVLVVAKANGNLYKVAYRNDEPETIKIKTAFDSKNDIEGICLIPGTTDFLIACKGRAALQEQPKILGKAIYKYNLLAETLSSLPELIISPDNESCYQFKPSGIAVEPQTGNIYVISAFPKCLRVFDKEMEPKSSQLLNQPFFKQPEGICFTPNGRLLIASEGGENPGKIMVFNPQN